MLHKAKKMFGKDASKLTVDWHNAYVGSVAFSPTTNPALLATGGRDNLNHAKIWSVETGECVVTLRGHTDFVNSVAFHPTDPTRIATGSSDNTARLWNTETGACTMTLTGHTSDVQSVAFHPTDPTRLATGSNDKTAKIWNTETGEAIRTLGYISKIIAAGIATFTYTESNAGVVCGHTSMVKSVAFHQTHSALLATGSHDTTAKIWNTETGECIMTLEGHRDYVTSVAFHPTKPGFLATGSWDNTAKIWNVATGVCVTTLADRTSLTSVAFNPRNPAYLATGSWGNTAKIWNTETGECVKTLKGHSNYVTSVAFHPNSTLLATGSKDTTAKIWNVGTKLQRRLDGAFVAANPITVKTLAGDIYTLVDWGLCKDLKAAVCKLAPDTLGKPATFELLGNLGGRGEGGGGVVQIDGKYGSDDRQRMMVKGSGFNFELTVVYSAAPVAVRTSGFQLPGRHSRPVRIISESTI